MDDPQIVSVGEMKVAKLLWMNGYIQLTREDTREVSTQIEWCKKISAISSFFKNFSFKSPLPLSQAPRSQSPLSQSCAQADRR